MKINLSLTKIQHPIFSNESTKQECVKTFIVHHQEFTDQSSNLILSQTFNPPKKSPFSNDFYPRVQSYIFHTHNLNSYIPVSISRQLASSFVHQRPPLAPIFTRQNKQPPTGILSSIGFFLHQRRLFRPFPSKLSYYFY